jgi:putative FmdB family regulatory protein
MPIYDYRCPTCTTRREVFKKIAEIDKPERCPKCAFFMERQLSAPIVRGDIAAYDCPITGKRIEGRRQHEENLKRHGCRVLESGESEAAARYKSSAAAAQVEEDIEIDTTVEQFVEALPTAKREQLAAEIQSGLDIDISRSTARI